MTDVNQANELASLWQWISPFTHEVQPMVVGIVLSRIPPGQALRRGC
jgi:hypothetical protein